MKILVTGFDPFGGETTNPALDAVKGLPDKIREAEIIKLEIPTVFNKSAEVTKQAILTYQPDVVLNVGQAGGRFTVTPERVAINRDDARIPDNEGNQPINDSIHEDGAPAYFTQLPIKAMVKMIRDAGLPAAVSNTAGTFVCNHIMYQVQYMIDKEFPELKGGFIHVPFIASQVIDKPETPFMNLADIITSLEKAIEAILLFDEQKDLETIEGTIH
ncbi:pyroglutamyl-peptidase I [Melissococcus plutonius]|uniref:Pyrrolidone-carboxylate peptidase n=1 Tax=Melissococcus plutonius TaxID=33970 RepID=A0A2Z5Y4I6_9ENTE|nr:pyroglutamyl-peptidase I [Melissococcus plutonius]BAL62905.1 pyroglutamyl-peptidase I [Melissococcus plutonius DAT561]MCV2499549.1 pyroglutamyl-peptidase I [Melissococcus plutonius]MCV2501476.1 pyroglutamyl-peptidase I [Melissococcus plutonius]MCV2505857.1 pyroglutamyl-peptidase I [Melissococcus plutonius]MCV2508135.1 pyroglutamyl-peptidase I [Melissococcus plutonius]